MIAENESLLTLAEARKLFHARSGHPHPATVYRWVTKGTRGVVLETVPQGGILCTSREAVQRFQDRLERSRTTATAQRKPSRALKQRHKEASREAHKIISGGSA